MSLRWVRYRDFCLYGHAQSVGREPCAGRVQRRLGSGSGSWALNFGPGYRHRRFDPAASLFTGIVGLKPTYGRVSRYGVAAFASSLDQVGPFGRNVQDAALGLEAIAGSDPLDPTSLDQPVVSWSKRLERPVRGLKAGVPKELLGLGVDSGVRRAFDRALEELSHLGLIIEEVSLPSLAYALDAYYIIAPSEASSNLSRFDGVRYGLSLRDKGLEEMYRDTRGKGFGPEVRLRVMLGTFALSAGYYDAYYLRAAKIRTLVRREFEKAFETCDVLLSPTTPSVAFAAGDRMMDPYMMYMTDVMTVPVNLAGLPLCRCRAVSRCLKAKTLP